MLERLSWKRLALEIFFFCLPALLLSLFIGHVTLLLLIAVFLSLLWNYYNQLKLSHWLWLDRSIMPPSGRWSWEPLFYGLYQMQQRNRRRRRELTLLIKRFRSGAESLPDAVVLITMEGNIFWCNRLAQHLLGFRWPEDNGQNILNLLRYPEFTNYLKGQNFEQPVQLQLNNERYIEFRVMPYVDDQLLLVARDVTHNNQLEGSRRNFFANVSHELRTPLTVLQGYLEMVEQDEMPKAMREKAMLTMRQQTKRMESLVSQLLTLSRIEASPRIDIRHKVDVPEMLKQIQHEASMLGQGRHQFHFSIDDRLCVYGNEEQLRSALSNLIFNAVNHTSEGTAIDVTWEATSSGAKFSVRDNGSGIAEEHLSHLTERFYRVDASRSRDTGGSGLGLAIVKHVLSHHDARLTIESQPGQGSQFSFVIPPQLMTQKESD